MCAAAAPPSGVLRPSSVDELSRLLRQSGLDLSLWGVAGSKSWLKEKWFMLWHTVALDEHKRRCEREIELIDLEHRMRMTSSMSVTIEKQISVSTSVFRR